MCVNLNPSYAIIILSAVPFRYAEKHSKERQGIFMKGKNITVKKHLFSLSASVLLSVILLSLLLTLFSCGIPRTDGITEDSSSHESESTDEANGSDRPSIPNEPTVGTENNNTDTLLSYYVSLVEELQEEIRALRAENFILSTTKPEPDTPTSQNPSDLYTYEKRNNEITILSYVGKETNVVVPREIDGCPVTEIGESAFAGAKIVSVVLPDTVVSIGWFAFSRCSSLTSITAGSTLSSIGYGAFDGCPSALTLISPKNSYFSKYGKSFGIAVRESE